MNSFTKAISNLKTHRKLLILNIMLIINLVWISAAAVINMGKINRLVGTMYHDHLIGISDVKQVEVDFLDLANAVNQVYAAREANAISVAAEKINQSKQEIIAKINSLREHFTSEDDKQRLYTLETLLTGAFAASQELLSSKQAGQEEYVNQAYSAFQSQMEKVSQNIEAFVAVKEKKGEEGYQEAERSFQATVRGQIYIILIGVVINFLAAWYISRIIVNPMNSLMGAIEKVATGDLTQKTYIETKDELGLMARAFNRAMDSVRALISQVSKTAQQVASSSQQLAAISNEAGKSAQQVAATIEQLAKGAEEQAKSANIAGDAVNQMSRLIKKVTESLEAMVKDSDRVNSLAQTGRTSVEKAIGQMNSIHTTVNDSAQVVKSLGERSREIGQIVDVITGIADQTNLLALNAAIEAARAGEQGRGFAVVAEEVRKLAEQSRQAAEKIAALIHEIQEETGKAVESMEAGTREVASGTEVIDSTGKAFAEIVAAIETMVRQINQVSEAAHQMAEGSQQVVRAVENIANITQESAASAEEVSASAEQQTASAEEIAASADALAKLAQELQNEVNKFRI